MSSVIVSNDLREYLIDKAAERKKIPKINDRDIIDRFWSSNMGALATIDDTKQRMVRGCSIKRYFASREDALNHVDFVNRRNEDNMTVYKCEFCDGHHVGHNYKKRKINVGDE